MDNTDKDYLNNIMNEFNERFKDDIESCNKDLKETIVNDKLYTRDEVFDLLLRFNNVIENSMDSDDDGNTFTNIDLNDWVKENL